jgi:hypothetical protein
MKNVRVKELEDFSNDFLRKIQDDEDEKTFIQRPFKTEAKIEDINESMRKKRSLNLPDFSITNLYRKKNKKKDPIVINKIYKYYHYSHKMRLSL